MEKRKHFASLKAPEFVKGFLYCNFAYFLTEESFTAGTVEVFDLATRTQSSGTIDGAGTLKITAHNRGFSITPLRDSFILYGKTFNIELGTENLVLANLEIENPIFPKQLSVEQITTVGELPPLSYHTAVSSKNNIYIYGGLGHNTSTSKDLIILSTSNTRSPVRNGRGGFRGRGGRGGGFGGGFGGGLLGDRQANNENEERGAQNDFILQRIKFSDEAPEERWNHCCSVIQDKLFIFGGETKAKKVLDDLWMLDLVMKKWNKINQGNIPSMPRTMSVACTTLDKLIICGGKDENNVWNTDVLIYEAKKNTWEVFKYDYSPEEPTHTCFTFSGTLFVCRGRQIYTPDLTIDPYLENEESRKNKYKEEFADLKKLFDNKMYSDIKFKVEGEEISAHKALLAAKCPYFERAFSSDMKEANSSIIEIPDIKASIFKKLLEYLYCSKLDLNEEVAFELLKVSDLYSLPALKNLCELFLAKSLTVVNAVKLTNLAQQYDAMKLKKNCLEFISIHKKNFHESDLVNLDKYSLIELFKLQP